jgi:di/tricarboxylate transporter
LDLPELPNWHALGVMALTAAALFLFTRERVPVETTSILVLAALAVSFTLFPYEVEGEALEPEQFFLGFGNEALIAISALMMASYGLVRTGALVPIGRWTAALWKVSPYGAMFGMLVSTGLISAFMNNTPQVVMMIPILISVAMRSHTSASKTLMPMTFSAQLGGILTPIGTSLNLLVIATAAGLGVPRFHMFDFFVPGAIVAAVGVAYLWLLAPRLLPDRKSDFADTKPRVFSAILHVPEGSFADGKPLAEVLKKTEGRLKVTRIERGENLTLARLPVSVLRAGDRIYVSDTPENLKELETLLEMTLYDGETQAPVDEEHPLAPPKQQLAQIVVTDNSPLARRTLNQAGFSYRYELTPLALHRSRTPSQANGAPIIDEVLHAGDVVLVQGKDEEIARLKDSGELLVLDATMDVPHTRKAPLAFALMLGIVAIAATKLLPIAVAALLGVVAMLVTGCMRLREALRALDAALIFLMASSLALSLALVQTGGARYVAEIFVALSAGHSPLAIMSGLILLMAFFANIVSNTAAAVIGTPIAVSIANLLGVAPEPFVLAVLFGVNFAFCTPMADNCNLLVFNAGGYRFMDFVRVGVPLTILMWIAATIVLPYFFPFSRAG